MKLESLGISNFKAFGNELQTIPIKPITLVFGPNSAGKSSLLHSLLWLNHVFQTGDCEVISPKACLGQINLGGFQQVRHRHQSNSVIHSLQFSYDCDLENTQGAAAPIAKSLEIKLAYGSQTRPKSDSSCDLVASRLLLDGKIFLLASKHVVKELDLKHPILAESVAKLSKSTGAEAETLQTFLSELIRNGVFMIRTINGLPVALDYDFIELSLRCDDAAPVSFKQAGEFIKDVTEASLRIFERLSNAVKSSVAQLTYLPPVRELPPRYFDPSKRDEGAWKEISRNPSLVKQLNQWLSSDKMLGTSYRLENRAFLPTESIQKRSPDLIRAELWNLLTNTNFSADAAFLMEQAQLEFKKLDKSDYAAEQAGLYQSMIDHELDFAESNDDWWDPPYEELTPEQRIQHATSVTDSRIDGGDADDQLWDHYLEHYKPLADFLDEKWSIHDATRRLSSGIENECGDRKYELSIVATGSNTRLALQDVGFGISQFLPVLIHAYASKNHLVTIEQPEIHIHPRLQAELGDVFIESALGENKNTFLLETHSEHLLLRIMKRMRQTAEGKLPEGMPPVRPEDVALLFVSPGPEGSVVQDIGLNERGELIKAWPGGFFEEGFNEMFD